VRFCTSQLAEPTLIGRPSAEGLQPDEIRPQDRSQIKALDDCKHLNLSDLALRQRSELTFLAAAGMPVAMTLMGSFLPALRAVLVDPLTAIRMGIDVAETALPCCSPLR
jgi:hypothetical protein